MAIPRVKVVNPNESWRGTECCIDGKKIPNVRSVDFRVAVDEGPQFTFETLGVRRHIVGGANRTLISVETPLRLCRIGTCRRLSAG